MFRSSNGTSATRPCYAVQLRKAIAQFLPHKGLEVTSEDHRVRWVPRFLVVAAILMGWDVGATLVDRFESVCHVLTQMYPGRRRPGKSYNAFMDALRKNSAALLEMVAASLRQSVRQMAQDQGCWEADGYVGFGGDGSKDDCTMTQSNEQELGVSSRKNSWPQMLLTCLFHVRSGLPWAFVRGGARDSERSHLQQMLGLLPSNALLLLDAGFTGYDLLKAILDGGRSFIVRAGSHVHLLTKLGYVVREYDGLVYLWPEKKQEKGLEPLVLRLVSFVDARNRRIDLLTNLSSELLCDAAVLRWYKRRWGIELMYRALKQTMGRRKMLSDSPENAKVELDWAMAGMWMVYLLNAQAAGLEAKRSFALALRALRAAMAQRGGSLQRALAQAVGDNYQRTGSKAARHWPRKKKEKPPGQPRARMANEMEIALAQQLRENNYAKSRAA